MKTYAFLLRYALLALPLACASLFSSCYNDEMDGCPSGDGPVTVRLNVSAARIGDLNGSRAKGDIVPADEHEFINTLKVYIVNDEPQTVIDLSPNLSTDVLAQTGDLKEWHSGPITLDPGTYTVYAFANIEKYNGEYETDQSGVQKKTGEEILEQCFIVGNQFLNLDLDAYRLIDPAKSIDLYKGMYIPMSGVSETLTIAGTGDMNNSGGASFTVYLDRLVSKVNMTITDLPEQVNGNTTVTFSNYSENVPLMAASTTSSHGERKATTPAMPLLEDETLVDGSYQLSFYVNETPNDANQGFTVTLNTGDTSSGGISEYRAITDRTEIPRNHVYPLSLMFPEYEPDFDWNSWAAPIGDYTPVVTEPEPGTYTVDIAEGAQFEFIVTGMNGGTLDNAVWNVPQELAAFMTDMSRDNNALSAALSAGVGVGTQIPLTVTVTWTDNVGEIGQRTMTRTYNVIINTVDITDIEFETQSNANSTRSGASGSYWLNREYLNMFKLK